MGDKLSIADIVLFNLVGGLGVGLKGGGLPPRGSRDAHQFNTVRCMCVFAQPRFAAFIQLAMALRTVPAAAGGHAQAQVWGAL